MVAFAEKCQKMMELENTRLLFAIFKPKHFLTHSSSNPISMESSLRQIGTFIGINSFLINHLAGTHGHQCL